jgi:hypothetical protein
MILILICFSVANIFLLAESKVSRLLVAAIGAAIQAGTLWISLRGAAIDKRTAA